MKGFPSDRHWLDMKLLSVLTFAATLAFASASYAQTTEVKEPDKITYKKISHVDFSKLEIAGELARPQNSYVNVRRNAKFRSFIRLRGNFHPEIVASIDNL